MSPLTILNGRTRRVRLSEAETLIQDADLLQFRVSPNSLISRSIATGGRGLHSHSAKASWWKGDLMCVEAREFRGCRAVTLKSQVEKFPGQIDVFHANALELSEMSHKEAKEKGLKEGEYYSRAEADKKMRSMIGASYGYLGILKVAFYHCPLVWIVRLFGVNLKYLGPIIRFIDKYGPDVKAYDDAYIVAGSPFCSHAVVSADREGGGVDAVPMLQDSLTEPADLTRSSFYWGINGEGYICTLIPDED